MKDMAECGHPLYWHNCYSGTYDLIHGDSMAHPAKMSPALCYRILRHLQELGLAKEEDTILDPMAGTGITNICAGAMGFKSISVELEDKFVGFQQQNKEYAERRLYKALDWQMIKGDSRRLSELLGREGLKSVTSPPYSDLVGNYGHERGDPQKYLERQERYNKKVLEEKGIKRPAVAQYSTDKDNIGNLVDTPLKSVMSPPYQDSSGHPSLGSVNKDDWGKEGKDIVKRRGLSGEYGEAEGQVGNLKSITSPPYSDGYSIREGGEVNEEYVERRKKKLREQGKDEIADNLKVMEYGSRNPENIGNLKDTPLKAITSPPYGETGVGDWKTGRAEFQAWVINEFKTKGYVEWQGKRYNEAEWRAMNHGRIDGRTTKGVHKHPTSGYSDDEDNIGNLPDKPLKVITSPPYGDHMKSEKSGIDWSKGKGGRDKSKEPAYNPDANYITSDLRYSEDKNNIGNLSDKPLKSVMSPPHFDTMSDWDRKSRAALEGQSVTYSDEVGKETRDNIGNIHYYDTGVPSSHKYAKAKDGDETYLEAMATVYSEIAKVSDVLVVVIKNPTRGGKLRRLDLDTIKILGLAGWSIHCQHRSLLFEELEQADLFEGSRKRVKGRLSFFKRLSWQNGQPVASWEDILVAVR